MMVSNEFHSIEYKVKCQRKDEDNVNLVSM